MGNIIINGRSHRGNNLSIVGGKVIIDGVTQDGAQLSGVVEVRVTEGVLGSLNTDCSVTCGNVQGHVSAGGSIQCGDIGGAVNAGGSIRCGKVTGPVNAGGSVRHG